MSWAIWAVVLGWQERKNIWLYGADFTLFVLPFFRMGRWNDLCMRATIRSRSADLLFQGGFQVFLTGNLLRFISMWTGTVKPESTAGYCGIKDRKQSKSPLRKSVREQDDRTDTGTGPAFDRRETYRYADASERGKT